MVNIAVLGVSLLLEGFSLLVAVRTVTAGAASHGLSFAEFVKRGMDPTSIAVMMEDGAACAGLVIAGWFVVRWLKHCTKVICIVLSCHDKMTWQPC